VCSSDLVVVPALAIALWMFFQFVVPRVAPDVWEKRVTNEQTINARIATYMSAWTMFQDHPFFGVGYTAFPETWERFKERYSREYKGEPSVSTPHNIVFSLLAETGLTASLAALFPFLCAIGLSLSVSRRARTTL